MNPPTKNDPSNERLPICPICRRRIQPESSEDGSIKTLPEGGQHTPLPTRFKISDEVAPIGRSEGRSVIEPAQAGDPVYIEQFEALRRLEEANRQPGANVNAEAERIAGHPELRSWLRESNRIADSKVTKGRADLVRQRRFGILRILEGEDCGFPVHQPVPRHRFPEGQGFWLLRLRDELEWLTISVLEPTVSRRYPRPTKDRLNHREASAILDWKASHLDMWLASRPHLVGGRIMIDRSRAVLFDTDTFVRWLFALMN